MKNIFIATDFSPASNNAAMHGIELARHFNARVFLFHAYELRVNPFEEALGVSTVELTTEMKEWLHAQAELINPKADVKLELMYDISGGADSILDAAASKQADLIICGARPDSRLLRRLLGSTTKSLVKKSTIPVLIVPENVEFKKPTHIVMGIDMDPETSPATLTLLKEISEKFFAKISVINVVGDGFEEDDKLRFQPPVNTDEIKHLRPAFEFAAGDDIAETIEGFAETHAADLLAVIPHRHSFAERLVTDSTTKELLLKTHIPLLVLPQRKAGSPAKTDTLLPT